MKKIRVISVCGSGTVTSSMIAGKVTDLLAEHGFRAETTTTNPGGVDGILSSGTWNLIVHTSPLRGKYDIPTINAVGFLTGMDEEGFIEELVTTTKSLPL